MNRIAALLLAALVPACTQAASDDPSSSDPGKADGTGCTPGAAGTLDTCFGFAPGPAVQEALYTASIVQSDDKILVFGTGLVGTAITDQPFIQRLLADGKPDPSFTAQFPAPQGGATFQPAAVAELADHRLVIAGTYGNQYYQNAYVRTLFPDGSVDSSSFDDSLIVTNINGSSANKIVIAADGSYYVAGTAECSIIFTCDTKSMFVAHFTANGKLDTSYGAMGYALLTSGQHTSLRDAVLTDDGIDVLGLESEEIWIAAQQGTFDKVVVGALDASGKPRAGFGTAGVFAWNAPGQTYGSVAQAFRVAGDGTITVASAVPNYQLLTIGHDGQLGTAQTYDQEQLATLEPHFAADGTIFATVKDFPLERFARFAADGTPDAGFASSDVQVPSFPAGGDVQDTEVVETSDAWLVTASIYLGSANPDSEVLLFRVWK